VRSYDEDDEDEPEERWGEDAMTASDEIEQALRDCGDTGAGWCAHAGTEHCMFRCPLNNEWKADSHDHDQPTPQ
jgi:hypothetical protein